jgi:hypothetical protein
VLVGQLAAVTGMGAMTQRKACPLCRARRTELPSGPFGYRHCPQCGYRWRDDPHQATRKKVATAALIAAILLALAAMIALGIWALDLSDECRIGGHLACALSG